MSYYRQAKVWLIIDLYFYALPETLRFCENLVKPDPASGHSARKELHHIFEPYC